MKGSVPTKFVVIGIAVVLVVCIGIFFMSSHRPSQAVMAQLSGYWAWDGNPFRLMADGTGENGNTSTKISWWANEHEIEIEGVPGKQPGPYPYTNVDIGTLKLQTPSGANMQFYRTQL